MAELQWLDGYSGQTVDELIGLEGHYRIDSLVLAFEQAIDQKAARVGYEKLSEEELIILAVEAMEREVNNGGFDQFFINAPEYAPLLVNALRRIGCPQAAKISQKAVTMVEKAPRIENRTPEDDEKLMDVLDECDNLYYKRPENIEESLFAFIKANRAKIAL
jgi:hypothetical protein